MSDKLAQYVLRYSIGNANFCLIVPKVEISYLVVSMVTGPK